MQNCLSLFYASSNSLKVDNLQSKLRLISLPKLKTRRVNAKIISGPVIDTMERQKLLEREFTSRASFGLPLEIILTRREWIS